MKIAIADDHRIVREGIRWMLAEAADVTIVGDVDDGPSLLALLDRESVDVVLLDVRMPGMSGMEVLETIRADHPQVRVIMLTMHDDPAIVRRAIELGASGYLLKNTGRGELLRALTVVDEGRAYIQGEVTGPLVADMVGDDGRLDGEQTPHLSPRELEVLQLVANGLENKQIARELGISDATVKTHLKGVFERLDVRSRAEAVAVGLRLGLIE